LGGGRDMERGVGEGTKTWRVCVVVGGWGATYLQAVPEGMGTGDGFVARGGENDHQAEEKRESAPVCNDAKGPIKMGRQNDKIDLNSKLFQGERGRPTGREKRREKNG